MDSAAFAARQLTPEMVKAADLIIGATREHIGGAAQLHPSALRKGFALSDLADRIDGVQDVVILAAPGVTRASKVAAEALIRRGEVRPRTPEESTIVDPSMQDESVFDAMDTQVRRAVPSWRAHCEAPDRLTLQTHEEGPSAGALGPSSLCGP